MKASKRIVGLRGGCSIHSSDFQWVNIMETSDQFELSLNGSEPSSCRGNP